jgi:hypothetical protein
MPKLLVYLDQSYVSTMAKHGASAVRRDQAALGKAVGDLYDLLSRLVDADKVLCPMSAVHGQETELDDRVSDAVYEILYELADGRSFHPYPIIEFGQTRRALRRYLSRPAEEEGAWQHAFNEHPHEPVRRPRMHVRIPLPKAFSEDDRRRKALMQTFREQQIALRAGSPPRSFADERRGQLGGVARIRYFDALREFLVRYNAVLEGDASAPRPAAGGWDQATIDYFDWTTPPPALRLIQDYAEITGKSPLECVADDEYWQFFASPAFDAVPYYDVFCSVEAGFLVHQRDRKPRGSDPYDFAALGSVLPYVDIVTTDAAMKRMLKQLGLDFRYGVEVYSPQQPDVEALAARLAHPTP